MNMYSPELARGAFSPRQRAFFLVLGGAVMLAASWAVDRGAGAPIALMAGIYGWVAGWLMRPPLAEMTPSEDEADAKLRHDLRGIVSPAFMISDRLVAHEDPAVQRAGEVVARTVQRITDRLQDDKK